MKVVSVKLQTDDLVQFVWFPKKNICCHCTRQRRRMLTEGESKRRSQDPRTGANSTVFKTLLTVREQHPNLMKISPRIYFGAKIHQQNSCGADVRSPCYSNFLKKFGSKWNCEEHSGNSFSTPWLYHLHIKRTLKQLLLCWVPIGSCDMGSSDFFGECFHQWSCFKPWNSIFN